VSLPIYPGLAPSDVDRVVAAIGSILRDGAQGPTASPDR
jgi:dTDP-4-amino-4,6-dideoxygalactose transaminase